MAVTFAQIRDAADYEARRLAVWQGEMIRTGDRAFSHPDALRRIEVWEKCALLIDVIRGDETLRARIMAAMKQPHAGQSGAAK